MIYYRDMFIVNKENSFFVKTFYTVLLFFFVYNISFQVAPFISTGRIVIIILFLYNFKTVIHSINAIFKHNIYILGLLFFIFCYSLASYIILEGIDNTLVSRVFHFILYSLFGSIVFSILFRNNLICFLSIFSFVTFAQAIIIIISFSSPAYREWLSSILVQSGHISFINDFRPPGFSNSSGAALSLIQAIGVFSALYRQRLSKSTIDSFIYIFIAIVIICSTIITARTGLLLSLLFLFMFIIESSLRNKIKILTIIAIGYLILMFSIRFYNDYLFYYNTDLEYIYRWAFELFLNEGKMQSSDSLFSMPIPTLNLETLFGTGLVNIGGANASGHDSGYIQNYYAMGLILAFSFYTSLFILLVKNIFFLKDKILLLTLIFGMFLVELKEPFIFKYIYPFFVFINIIMAEKKKYFIHLNHNQVSVLHKKLSITHR